MEEQAVVAIFTIAAELNVFINNCQWYDSIQDINQFESRLKFYRTKVSESGIIL